MQRLDQGPQARPDSDPRPCPGKPDRLRITFPRLLGYRYDLDGDGSPPGSPRTPSWALSDGRHPDGNRNVAYRRDHREAHAGRHQRRRLNEVAFLLAKLTLEKYFRDDEGHDKPWLFPQVLDIAKRWLAECVVLKDNTFPQLLLLVEFAHDASDRIYKAIVAANEDKPILKPILRPYDTIGSTRYVDFDTTRSVYATRADKCHFSHVVADTVSWEQKLAQTLEDMDEVVRYVRTTTSASRFPIPSLARPRATSPTSSPARRRSRPQ